MKKAGGGISVFFSLILGYALISHLSIVFAPWQLEYREGAVLLQVRGILHGVQVYSNDQLPLYLNVYGSIYNSVAVAFSKAFGNNLFSLRLVSFLCIGMSIFVFHEILKLRMVPRAIRLALCVSLYTGFLFATTPLARPDSLGLFFYLSCIWLFERFGTEPWPMLGIIALSCLGFLTKEYFVIIGPVIISYIFFFQSKKRGMLYGVAFVVSLLLVIRIDEWLIPGYLPLTLAVNSGSASSISIKTTVYMLKQTAEFGFMFMGALLICWNYQGWNLKSLRSRARVMDLSRYGSLIVFALLTLELGHHGGAWLTYYVQLLAPFMLITVAQKQWQPPKPGNIIAACVTGLAYVMVVCVVTKAIMSPVQVWRLGKQMKVMNDDLLQYTEVLASPMLVSSLVSQNKSVYTSGQTIFFEGGAADKAMRLPGSILTQADFLKTEDLYEKRIATMIVSEHFDLIVRDDQDSLQPFWTAAIEKHYRAQRSRKLGRLIETEWVACRIENLICG